MFRDSPRNLVIKEDLERKNKKKKETALNIELDEEKDFTTIKKLNMEKIFQLHH